MKGADTGRRIEVEVEPSQLRERLRRALEEGYDHFIGINVVDYPRAGVMEVYYFVESVQRGSNEPGNLVYPTSLVSSELATSSQGCPPLPPRVYR